MVPSAELALRTWGGGINLGPTKLLQKLFKGFLFSKLLRVRPLEMW